MLDIVKEIQADNFTHFNCLQEKFQPLVNAWLYKINPHPNDKEDYLSCAKVVLLESARSYDFTKNVPFASYYKINLYHWFGNHMMKKKWPMASSNAADNESIEIDFNSRLVSDEKLKLILDCSCHLTKQEKFILNALLNNQSTKEIAEQLDLSKKTILNKKYMIIKKIKEMIKEGV